VLRPSCAADGLVARPPSGGCRWAPTPDSGIWNCSSGSPWCVLRGVWIVGGSNPHGGEGFAGPCPGAGRPSIPPWYGRGEGSARVGRIWNWSSRSPQSPGRRVWSGAAFPFVGLRPSKGGAPRRPCEGGGVFRPSCSAGGWVARPPSGGCRWAPTPESGIWNGSSKSAWCVLRGVWSV